MSNNDEEIISGEIYDEKTGEKVAKGVAFKDFLRFLVKTSAPMNRLVKLIIYLSPLLLLIAFLVCGGCIHTGLGVNNINGWQAFYPLLILIPVPRETFVAIKTKQWSRIPILFIVLSIYLFIGMWLGIWHPTWVMLFAAPIYYQGAKFIERYFDYEALGRELAFDSYGDEEVSAGEYFCGDEDASDTEIGESYVAEIGIEGVSHPEYYFDFEEYGRMYAANTTSDFTSGGFVEAL